MRPWTTPRSGYSPFPPFGGGDEEYSLVAARPSSAAGSVRASRSRSRSPPRRGCGAARRCWWTTTSMMQYVSGVLATCRQVAYTLQHHAPIARTGRGARADPAGLSDVMMPDIRVYIAELLARVRTVIELVRVRQVVLEREASAAKDKFIAVRGIFRSDRAHRCSATAAQPAESRAPHCRHARRGA